MFAEILTLIRASAVNLIIALFCFLLVGNFFKSMINVALELMLAPMFHLRIMTLSAFGVQYMRDEKGWKRTGKSGTMFFEVSAAIDTEATKDMDSKKVSNLDIADTIVCKVLTFLICSGVGAFLLIKGHSVPPILAVIVYTTGLGLIFHSLVSLIFAIFTLIKIKKSLAGYIQKASEKLRSGCSFSELKLKSVKDLPYTKTSRIERVLYFMFYFAYLDATGRCDELWDAVNELEKDMPELANASVFNIPENIFPQYIPVYYDLLYFYSCYNINEAKAKILYIIISRLDPEDDESNAQRILAYYHANVIRDRERAVQNANTAFDNLGNIKSRGEREYEEQCVSRLRKYLNI